ncbi:type II secretion system F family protein [Salisediminibacterium selenitireducens]|uniref:Type II secretion system F domain protein n=1 Tax=Bacillus selenitireducens (strain ATCC 700615 / DSM 15326 / MLS10) TaxID=439292 RepID=D6XT17_BACIE|nr:type II secretion system F family protein [Salisediminibacterium selenitireducens]ADH98953.1 Type II secretion system F domain protein [[Bacillus] selenitireducens MLS10]
MAYYQYEARSKQGELVSGKIKADSKLQAERKLTDEKGVNVLNLSQMEGILYQDIEVFSRVSSKDMVIFLRQMTTLLTAGISLVDSVRLLGEQTPNKALRSALVEVEEDLRQGISMSQSTEKHRKVFQPLVVNMIRAGEAGGNLDEIFERLAVYYEKQNRIKQKVISALAYPATLGVIAIGVVMFLLAVVVPSFADMFAGFDSELPWITLFVLNAGDWMQSWVWLILLLTVAAIFGIRAARKNDDMRYYLDYFMLKMPIVGGILQKSALARMSRTLSSLFTSSVPVLQATSIVERVVGNEVLANVIRDIRTSLEKGESMAGPMEKHWMFPPLVVQMVVVGERTGSLDQMLDRVALFYEEEVDQAAERLKSLMEPMLIAVLAVVVGVIVASIAIPMFEIFDTIG